MATTNNPRRKEDLKLSNHLAGTVAVRPGGQKWLGLGRTEVASPLQTGEAISNLSITPASKPYPHTLQNCNNHCKLRVQIRKKASTCGP